MKVMILFIVVFGTLALFNPTETDFANFAQEKAQTIVSDRVRESAGYMGEMGASMMGMLARQVASGSVERSNYVIASLYTIDLNGPQRGGGEWVFLGAGGQFFELERPAILDPDG